MPRLYEADAITCISEVAVDDTRATSRRIQYPEVERTMECGIMERDNGDLERSATIENVGRVDVDDTTRIGGPRVEPLETRFGFKDTAVCEVNENALSGTNSIDCEV